MSIKSEKISLEPFLWDVRNVLEIYTTGYHVVQADKF